MIWLNEEDRTQIHLDVEVCRIKKKQWGHLMEFDTVYSRNALADLSKVK